MGPAVGSALFAVAGYRGCFYTFGALNILIAAVIYSNFPKITKESSP